MGTALATAKSTAVATQSDNPWLAAAADSNDFDGDFVKLNGNTGEYTKGQGDDEIPIGTRVIINMAGVHHGYICWVESEVVDRAMSLVEAGPKPAQSSLADHGPYEKHTDGTEDGWSENHQIPMADEDGNKLMLQASSGSAVRSMKRFYAEYGKKRSLHVDDDGNYMVPVVELEVGSFTSKKNPRAGKKFFPVLKIVQWISFASVADLFDDAGEAGNDPESYAETAQEAAPAPKKRAARAPKPEPVQPEPAPEPEVVDEQPEPEPEVETPPPAPEPARKQRNFAAPADGAEPAQNKAATNAAAAKVAEGRREKRF